MITSVQSTPVVVNPDNKLADTSFNSTFLSVPRKKVIVIPAPFFGSAGPTTTWDELPETIARERRMSAIHAKCSDRVHSLQFEYSLPGNWADSNWGEMHGAPSQADPEVLYIRENQYITSFSVLREPSPSPEGYVIRAFAVTMVNPGRYWYCGGSPLGTRRQYMFSMSRHQTDFG